MTNTTSDPHESYGSFAGPEGRAFLLTEYGSRRWGAYLPDGVSDSDAAAFRRDMRAILRRHVELTGRSVEVFALGAPIDAQDWILDVVER